VILGSMWAFDTTLDRRTPGAGLLAPLNVTAYVAWLAAAASGLFGHLGEPLLNQVQWVLGIFTLVGFLGAFCARAILEDCNASGALLGASVVIQAVLASLSLWSMSDHFQAILLVLTAAQLAALRDRRVAMLALTLANCALFVWLARSQPPAKAIQVSLAYVAFELFAAFVSRAAYTAQESRREVLRTNRELQAARALVAEGARAQERLRLSRELHDIAGHKLTALKLHLALEMRTRATAGPSTLSQCLTLADELLTDMRMVVSALRQEDGIDLRTALLSLDPAVDSVSVQFNLEPEAIVSDMGKAEALLRCAQEGLTNALRHGGATEVLVTLSRREEQLVLSVEDNGTGYTSPTPPMGNGLRGLRERLEEFQGVVSLDRRAPRGCVLRAALPESSLTC
jgi:signal transduction histidine kinase